MIMSDTPLAGEFPHILVVDDDNRLRELLRRYLADNGFRVTVASDAAEAREQLGSIVFDLIVMDVMMPGESGLVLTDSLRQKSTVPILMLTAMGGTEHRINGLEVGADDYLAKPFEPRELVLRIRTILRRAEQAEATPPGLQIGPCTFDLLRETLFRGNVAVRLTTAEANLLKALALRPGHVCSRVELAEACGLEGSDRSIDVQVTRLRKKIEPDPKMPRYLQTVRGHGYVLRPD
jgi:two-component system phosphate regulon response regulator OmpR